MRLRPTTVLALAAALPIAALANPPEVLRICYEIDDAFPFIGPTVEHGQPGKSLLVELIQSAAEQAELRIEFQRQPWKRCILQLQQGTSDAIFAAIWQPDRDAWGQFPGRDPQRKMPAERNYRLWQVDYPIIVRNGSALTWNGQQFSGITHGLSAPIGYVANARLGTLGVLAKGSYSAEIGLNMVAMQRLDGYVLERQIARTYISKLGLQAQLSLLPEPLLRADWHVPFSHQFYQKHPDLAQRFWQALAEQREAHRAELTERYLAPE
jgi:polar amino acid transport system substrate-binding protein